VGRFYPHVERRHPKIMQKRQDLILYLANIHAAALKSGMPLGFCEIPMRLMSLREWVYDYRNVFDYFFDVKQTGYNLGDKHEISIVTPKKLSITQTNDAKTITNQLMYVPPPIPKDGVVSKVYIQLHKKEEILDKLAQANRLDLHAPVTWLLSQKTDEMNFYFSRAGKLQLRDTSTWPIQAVETWPSWLREALFGPGIDIESAYTQFLLDHVKQAYKGRENLVGILYPDLVRSLDDKVQWRNELCKDLLGMEINEENISIVKKICMSLANGSKVSPAIMIGNGGFSVTRDIVIQSTQDISPTNLIRIGERLSRISKQYAQARKVVCTLDIKISPSRINQKKVFQSYFEWEREARYEIWEAVGRHGIMVHDGLDGIPQQYIEDLPNIIKTLNIKIS
jgi:hypothetical protein